MARTEKRRCDLCDCKRVLPAFPGGVCRPCAHRFGLPEEPGDWPGRDRPCARCGHGVLLACIVRQRLGIDQLAPLAASFERKLKTRILTGEEEIEYDKSPDHDAPRGVFIAYICRACGFVDWYALNPGAIPVGPAYGTKLVETHRHPYR
jgi:hypothetical protein